MTAAQTEIEHSWCLPLASSLPPLVIACNLLRKSITRSFKRRLYSPMFTLFRLSYTIYIVRCYRIMRCSAECKVISPSHAWNLGLTGPNTPKLNGALPLDLNIDFLNNSIFTSIQLRCISAFVVYAFFLIALPCPSFSHWSCWVDMSCYRLLDLLHGFL